MAKNVRIDSDVHDLVNRIINGYPLASRPSKQQFLNEFLRRRLVRVLNAAGTAPGGRRRKASCS